MTWLATYVEYIGPGGDFQLCVGSDDGVQVWAEQQIHKSELGDDMPMAEFRAQMWKQFADHHPSARKQLRMFMNMIESVPEGYYEGAGAQVTIDRLTEAAEAEEAAARLPAGASQPNATKANAMT